MGGAEGRRRASSSFSPPPTPPSSVYPSLSPYTARRRAEQRWASVAFLGKPQLCRRRRGGRPPQRHRHDGHGLPVSPRLLPTADLARLLCHSPRRLAARPSPALPVRANPGWRPLRCRPSSAAAPAPPSAHTSQSSKRTMPHTSLSIPGMHLRPRRRRRFSVLLSEDEEEEREEREGIKVFISYVQLICVSHCFFFYFWGSHCYVNAMWDVDLAT